MEREFLYKVLILNLLIATGGGKIRGINSDLHIATDIEPARALLLSEGYIFNNYIFTDCFLFEELADSLGEPGSYAHYDSNIGTAKEMIFNLIVSQGLSRCA